MKNKYFIIPFIAIICILSFSSCRTSYYKTREMNISNRDIKTTPTVVDVQVDINKKITYKNEYFVQYPQSKNRQQTEQLALNAARYNLITQNGIDVLVDPIYKITFKKRNHKKCKIELTGYAGYYKNPRTIQEDIKSFSSYSMEDVQKYVLFNNPTVLKNDCPPMQCPMPPVGKKNEHPQK